MTFETYQHFLQQFQQRLQQLKTKMIEADIVPEGFRTEVLQIQQLFQTQLAPIDLASAVGNEAESLVIQIQAIQTEVNKQLRLLETDAVFLQAARQPITIQQREQQIHQRLDLLLHYCDAISKLL